MTRFFQILEKLWKYRVFYLANEPSNVPFQEPFAWDPSLTPFSGDSGISYFARTASGQFFF